MKENRWIHFHLGYLLLFLPKLILSCKTSFPADIFSFSNTFPSILRGNSAKLLQIFLPCFILIKCSFLRNIYLKAKEESIYRFCKVLIQHTFMSQIRNCILWESKVLTTMPVIKLSPYCFKYFSTSENYLFMPLFY